MLDTTLSKKLGFLLLNKVETTVRNFSAQFCSQFSKSSCAIYCSVLFRQMIILCFWLDKADQQLSLSENHHCLYTCGS